MPDKLSTSALAKLRGLDAKQLFADLKKAGYINRHDEQWILTELGAKFGGEYVQHAKFGTFIVWPENLLIDMAATSGSTLSATQVGEYFKLNPKKMNQLFSELGWITKSEQGWRATASGLRAGAQQREDKASAQKFVVWHDSIRHNPHLRQSVVEFLGHDADEQATDKSYASFRQKFAAKHRTLDGHYVRSVGELLIDNWLYLAGVAHAYQRPLPIEQPLMSDFYLPSGNVYIQFWGTDGAPIDDTQREATRAVYADHQFNLIEITPEEVHQLDDILPARLREHGIKAY
ncbi:glycerol kinase [Vibrio furnissii]|uniref:glycerol kinase n=1 Tax=Vibrio furnissii TaxID=29494 RepID=UPI00130388AE|nr:glycerol kinase [Vibrio furnissii]WJG28262.1 glycerol kinase [Vibrio furnissii]